MNRQFYVYTKEEIIMAAETFDLESASPTQSETGDGALRILLSSLSGAIAMMAVVLCFSHI